MRHKPRSRLPGAPAPVKPGVGALLEQAVTARARGLLERAAELCRAALELEPGSLDASQMLGVIALQSGLADEAVEIFRRAAELNPARPHAHANLGTALLYLRRPEEALPHYDRALALDPGFAAVLANQGNALRSLKRHSQAAEAFRRLREVAPHFDFALGSCFGALRDCCDWRDYALLLEQTTAGVRAGARVERPFSLLSVSDSLALQRECARLYAAYLCPTAEPPLWTGERYIHERIRVAYLSADFRDHVVSYVMAPVYERHDRERFHTIGISLAAEDDSDIVRRSRRALGEFVSVASLSDQSAAELVRRLEVDIAVDLMGFTEGCRPGIFARRPAPVHISLLGFPGTLGVPYMDYIVADDFVIPDSLEAGYAEKAIRLPDCFQPSDARRAQLAAAPPVSRAAAGLPEDALVLCCFNNSYKLSPPLFRVWTRLLERVPQSVLWLLGEDAMLRENLLKEAAAFGIDARRLVFARRVPYVEHLARLSLADLFLDTLPFNGGATAGDVLCAGVPLLTCAGEAFAARMAGSLLRSLGLQELIATSLGEYEGRALELLDHPQRLAELRARLAGALRDAPLFDAARYCRHLEAAYLRMSARVANGEQPSSLSVAVES